MWLIYLIVVESVGETFFGDLEHGPFMLNVDDLGVVFSKTKRSLCASCRMVFLYLYFIGLELGVLLLLALS